MVGRIWKVYNEVKGYVVESNARVGTRRPTLLWVVSILIEGCVVIFCMQLAVTVLFTTGHPGYNIAAGPILAAYGLNATAMIVRVHSNKSYETYGGTQHRSTTLSFARTRSAPKIEKSIHVSGDTLSVDSGPTRVNSV